jgi:hypothetical protein
MLRVSSLAGRTARSGLPGRSSVRSAEGSGPFDCIGALLASDALLITAGINPLTASPGAPLSLDAPSQPAESMAVALGTLMLAISSYLCVRAIMLGEEYSAEACRRNGRRSSAD